MTGVGVKQWPPTVDDVVDAAHRPGRDPKCPGGTARDGSVGG